MQAVNVILKRGGRRLPARMCIDVIDHTCRDSLLVVPSEPSVTEPLVIKIELEIE